MFKLNPIFTCSHWADFQAENYIMFEPLLGAGSRIWRSKCKKTTSLPCTAEDHADEEKHAEPFPEAHVRNNYYHAYMQYDHAWQFRTCFVR
jgi:hypothetical protein